MVTIGKQFNGPVNSGNGGYVSGVLARKHDEPGPVTIQLRMPPPLESPLTHQRSGTESLLVTHGGALVAKATSGHFNHEPPRFADANEVLIGQKNYPTADAHPFNRCFTCGAARDEGDGLRIFSGVVTEGFSAAPWHAHPAFAEHDGTIAPPVAWAALDCPGGWAADLTRRPMVLGTMTAEVTDTITADETYHAVGQLIGEEGRKSFTASALYSRSGDLLGRAEHVWIAIDPADFLA